MAEHPKNKKGKKNSFSQFDVDPKDFHVRKAQRKSPPPAQDATPQSATQNPKPEKVILDKIRTTRRGR